MAEPEHISLKDAIQLFMDKQEYERRHSELREEVKALGIRVDALDKEVAANKDFHIKQHQESIAWANQSFANFASELFKAETRILGKIDEKLQPIDEKFKAAANARLLIALAVGGWLVAIGLALLNIYLQTHP